MCIKDIYPNTGIKNMQVFLLTIPVTILVKFIYYFVILHLQVKNVYFNLFPIHNNTLEQTF